VLFAQQLFYINSLGLQTFCRYPKIPHHDWSIVTLARGGLIKAPPDGQIPDLHNPEASSKV
jgi:hypothetical protein